MQEKLISLIEEYVNTLIDYDEVERALLVLDNIPAHLRDNPGEKLSKLRLDITSSLCTPSIYKEDPRDSDVNEERAIAFMNASLRGVLIAREVENYNLRGIWPHIVDMGPGDYWLPLGLKCKELKFTYRPLAINQNAFKLAEPMLQNYIDMSPKVDRPHIFVANEVIEHLHCPSEIATNCSYFCSTKPDFIHISTPTYCFDPCKKNWNEKGGLPHLRAYTPQELYLQISKMFPGYQFQLYQGPVMSIRAIKNGIEPNVLIHKDEQPK